MKLQLIGGGGGGVNVGIKSYPVLLQNISKIQKLLFLRPQLQKTGPDGNHTIALEQLRPVFKYLLI